MAFGVGLVPMAVAGGVNARAGRARAPGQQGVLRQAHRAGPLKLGRLAALTGMTASNASKVVTDLVDTGLAVAGERAPAPRMLRAVKPRFGRQPGSYEFQMLYGIRPHEQERLVRQGQRMRVYVPYGDEWYGYFMRRLAERPANLAFFLRGLATRS